MFDVGFLELFVVAIISLIVLGPERLPKAARTVGQWVGKAKRSFGAIKTEIDRELKVQELKQKVEQQKSEISSQLDDNSMQDSLGEVKSAIDQINQQAPSSNTSDSSSEQELMTNSNKDLDDKN